MSRGPKTRQPRRVCSFQLTRGLAQLSLHVVSFRSSAILTCTASAYVVFVFAVAQYFTFVSPSSYVENQINCSSFFSLQHGSNDLPYLFILIRCFMISAILTLRWSSRYSCDSRLSRSTLHHDAPPPSTQLTPLSPPQRQWWLLHPRQWWLPHRRQWWLLHRRQWWLLLPSRWLLLLLSRRWLLLPSQWYLLPPNRRSPPPSSLLLVVSFIIVFHSALRGASR